MKTLFEYSGTSPTQIFATLASGSAINYCASTNKMPDFLKLETLLNTWQNHLLMMNAYAQSKLLFEKKILTLDDLIKITGFAKQTIYNMVAAKRIPYSKRGGRLFFSTVEVLNWLEEGDPL